MNKFLFEVKTPLGFSVRCGEDHWFDLILQKHPILKGKEDLVQEALTDPDVIRQSQKDKNVYLFYLKKNPRWMCAVIKDKSSYGFLITAYPTDSIKEGEEIWKK